MRIGVISDTHGLLRPEAEQALQGVDLIVHAGDVVKPEILARLKSIAPVFAVRGNVNTYLGAGIAGDGSGGSGRREFVRCSQSPAIGVNPEGGGFAAVISGHTHQAEQWERNGEFI